MTTGRINQVLSEEIAAQTTSTVIARARSHEHSQTTTVSVASRSLILKKEAIALLIFLKLHRNLAASAKLRIHFANPPRKQS